jgi:hypothetical protein
LVHLKFFLVAFGNIPYIIITYNHFIKSIFFEAWREEGIKKSVVEFRPEEFKGLKVGKMNNDSKEDDLNL